MTIEKNKKNVRFDFHLLRSKLQKIPEFNLNIQFLNQLTVLNPEVIFDHQLEHVRPPTGTYLLLYTKVTENGFADIGSRKSFTVNVPYKTR